MLTLTKSDCILSWQYLCQVVISCWLWWCISRMNQSVLLPGDIHVLLREFGCICELMNGTMLVDISCYSSKQKGEWVSRKTVFIRPFSNSSDRVRLFRKEEPKVQKCAPSGNRTQGISMATRYFTTKPMVLIDIVAFFITIVQYIHCNNNLHTSTPVLHHKLTNHTSHSHPASQPSYLILKE